MPPVYERPSWAVSEDISEDGTTIFRDGAGQELRAIAFTEAELTLMRRALAALPQDEAVRSMQDKLRDDRAASTDGRRRHT
jgi:hypothetical protein